MEQGGDTRPGVTHLRRFDIGEDHVRFGPRFAYNFAPWRHDERMPIGGAADLVIDALRRRENTTSRFNRPRAQQDGPMGLTRQPG